MAIPPAPAPAQTTTSISRWWRIAGGLSMNLALGSLYAWSTFVGPLEKQHGWKRADLSLTFTLAVVAFALSFVLAGKLQDRFGPLWVSVTGGLLVSLGFFMCGYAHTHGSLYFWFGIVVGMGNGFGYATPIPVMAKWFPDRRGLAVGLAVAGYGGGSALFGPLAGSLLLPRFGLSATFQILGGIFLVMTMMGACLLRNPPSGYVPEGWSPGSSSTRSVATTYDFSAFEMLRTPTFYLMWLAYALGASSGLMVISQLVPYVKGQGVNPDTATLAFLIGAAGNVAGRMFSGWMSDSLGRLNVLRLMIGISALAMPLLHAAGGNVPFMFAMVFVVYWCFGTQLSVNASTASDFWGTRNAGTNYGMLYTAYGTAGVIGPRLGSTLFDKYGNYQAAFHLAAVLAVVALICELLARRPNEPKVVRSSL